MPDTSKRKRRWWLRLLIAAIILICAGISVLVAMTIVSHRELEHRIASLRESGEPILPADFSTPNPDAADNGALILSQAIRLVDKNEDSDVSRAFDDLHPAYPLRPNEIATMQAMLKQDVAAFDLIDQAQAKPRMEWKLNIASPVRMNVITPDLNGVRGLCYLLSSSAMLDHVQGNDSMSLHRIEQIIFISRYADKDPSLIGHLVAIGCGALASSQIDGMAPDLKIGTAPGDATPEEVRQIIDILLDDTSPRTGSKLAMRGERMMQLDTMQSLLAGIPISKPGDMILVTKIANFSPARFLIYRNALAMLNYMTDLMPALDEPNWPAAQAKIPPMPAGNHLSPGTLFLQILLPSMDRAIETDFRGKTDRRLSAIVLAVRWYAVEHDGKLPAKLADLSPRYLATIPSDPFAAGDQPMRYRPTGDSPIVYSVGENGVDDSGSEEWGNPPKRYHANPPTEWDMKDRVVHLTRQPREIDDESAPQPRRPEIDG